jgi:twitching motility protein PilI
MNPTPTSKRQHGLVVAGRGGAIAPKNLTHYAHSHLKFRLGSYTALLSTNQVLEAVTLPAASLTPMPNMPPAMLGLINHRSQVIWVTDLALLLGIPVAHPHAQQYNLVLLQVDHVLVGLRVHEISGILSLPPAQIFPVLPHIASGLVPFLRGCFFEGSEVLLVLNGEAILKAPALQPS